MFWLDVITEIYCNCLLETVIKQAVVLFLVVQIFEFLSDSFMYENIDGIAAYNFGHVDYVVQIETGVQFLMAWIH